MFREAVILAGGFGTRLSHVLGNVPKPMAPVFGKPFLCYVLDRLKEQGIEHVVLATGYMHSVIANYFCNSYGGVRISYSEEKEPLFTGGAILKATELIESDDFLVVNGDTLFDIDYERLQEYHYETRSVLTIALRQVADTGRYGAVQTADGVITGFTEKAESAGAGDINGGVYAINKQWLLSQHTPKKFSFEKELLEVRAGERVLRGLRFSDYFIDIGVPVDYLRAQHEFGKLFETADCLFLDRDGVLNRQIIGDYVRCWADWQWIDGALEALAQLSQSYRRIFIVSNQQGVGKGLFSQTDLDDIHCRMLNDIASAGGRVDRVYVSTDLAQSGSVMRKPEIGMALLSKHDFPDVDFARSVMVGDSVTDMQFGYAAGMRCVYLNKANPTPAEVQDYTDIILENLYSFAEKACQP